MARKPLMIALAVAALLVSAQSRAQTTTPTPNITLYPSFNFAQTYSGCMVNCSSQNVTCSSPCVALNANGFLAQPVQGTTSQSQCFNNCITQQQACQATCRNLTD
jgi:hypothetical protein